MLYCNFYICLIYFILSYVEAAADEPTEGGKCTALSTCKSGNLDHVEIYLVPF
jgi:hypothetical protein